MKILLEAIMVLCMSSNKVQCGENTRWVTKFISIKKIWQCRLGKKSLHISKKRSNGNPINSLFEQPGHYTLQYQALALFCYIWCSKFETNGTMKLCIYEVM